MSKLQTSPHQPGDVVSTAHRYSKQAEYQKAVDSQKGNHNQYLEYYLNAQGTACSFKLCDYTELLLVWQPKNQGYTTDCQIKYVYLDKTVVGLVVTYYSHIIGKRYRGIESIGESLPGVTDGASESRRVVFQDTYNNSLGNNLDGFIINPPYPPFAPHTNGGRVYLVLGLVMALVGVGVIARRLMRRND